MVLGLVSFAIDLSSVCVLPNQDSHMTHRINGQSEIWHSATPLMCPFEIPLKPTVWSEFLNIFHAICTAQRTSLMMPFSFSSIHWKRRADPDVNLPELVGLPQCVPFGNLGWRKQMPSALWAFHAHAHPALWIEKCSYSINAPFKILLQQHSSLYCNYTYCISLYSGP